MLKKIACFGDCHSPFHSRRSINLALKVFRWWKPDVLVCMGDVADFFAVSRFEKDPLKDRGLKHELATVNKILDEFDVIASRKVFLCGNHEDRLNRYLLRNAPALTELLTVQELLRLEERGWEWYPYQEPCYMGKLGLVHDLGYAGKTALRQTIDAHPSNLIMGHSHRQESLTRGNLRREVMTISSFGWLGDPREIDYLPSVKVKQDWTHGFGMIYMEEDGTPHINSVAIARGKCLVEGKLWT